MHVGVICGVEPKLDLRADQISRMLATRYRVDLVGVADFRSAAVEEIRPRPVAPFGVHRARPLGAGGIIAFLGACLGEFCAPGLQLPVLLLLALGLPGLLIFGILRLIFGVLPRSSLSGTGGSLLQWLRVHPLFRLVALGEQLLRASASLYEDLCHSHWQPEVLHCVDLDALPAALLLGRRWGIRVLYDAHAFGPRMARDLAGLAPRLVDFLELFLAVRCDQVLAGEELLALELEARWEVPCALVTSFPLTEFPAFPRIAAVENFLAGRPGIFFWSEGIPDSDLRELLETWSRAPSSLGCLLLSAESPRERQRLRQGARRWASGCTNLRVLEVLGETSALSLARLATAGLLPYRSASWWRRQGPQALGIYRAASLRVIAYPTPGLVEYADACFEPGQPGDFARAIEEAESPRSAVVPQEVAEVRLLGLYQEP
jgi:glycosyltransferase involved in cell wall biosynthesis